MAARNLGKDINSFMNEKYPNGIPFYKDLKEPKVIHMAYLGTNNFSEHEIATIDTPIVQRLKYISQLGPVYNVFPTARHSRFEHTLGVAILIKRMWDALESNNSFSFLNDSKRKKNNFYNLRMAALLHDIGHCPFSHVSETVLKDFSIMRVQTSKLKASPHEILSYYLLKSDVFQEFFRKLSEAYSINLNGMKLDGNKIADYVIGKNSDPDEQYLNDLINGEIDADKLDYIIRDSYFSGVPSSIGIDRLLLSLRIEEIPSDFGNVRKLILHEKGITSLEQLISAKTILYSSVYHHQKVRALDCMIVSILRKIKKEKIEINGSKIESPVDLLALDDYDLLKFSSDCGEVGDLCKHLKEREAFKRALVISTRTIVDRKKDDESTHAVKKMIEDADRPESMEKLNEDLVSCIGEDCGEFDVALDFPTPPTLNGKEGNKFIKIGTEVRGIHEIFPADFLFKNYISNKWSGHIFAIEKYKDLASKEGKEFLENKYGIEFNDKAFPKKSKRPITLDHWLGTSSLLD